LNEAELGAEEEPLNSEDDVTDEDAADLFETDNVVVCQYDKVIKGLINYLNSIYRLIYFLSRSIDLATNGNFI